jgi:uncharacterized protein YjbI with pentapeptide repeats
MAGLPRTAWVLGAGALLLVAGMLAGLGLARPRAGDTQRVVLVMVVGVGVLLACVTVFPRPLIPDASANELAQLADGKERLEALDRRRELQNNARTALLQGTGGAALLLGLWFTWHQTNTNITVTRQGQIAERFGRAIEELGGSSMESRLGGIYGLELIAKQDPSQRGVVAEVLVAYVRSHAPKMPAPEAQSEQSTVGEELRDRFPDVQAALTVLSRGHLFTEFYQQGFSFNFARLDLRRADLRGADLRGTNLNEAALNGADLRDADLRGLSLSGVDLSEVKLNGANLRGLGMVKGRLQGVEGLTGVDLRDARLILLSLSHVDLRDTDLRGAFFSEVQLDGANLSGADLRDATLRDVNLSGANLSSGNLSGAHLRHGVNLSEVDLRSVNLRGARVDDPRDVAWPDGFD